VFGITYHLTGSLAIAVYVKTQVVQGIEVVADIKFSQVQSLVVQLEKLYDVKESAIREAIEHRGSFGLVHHDTMQKIDVFLPAYRAYSQVRQEKAQRHPLEHSSRSILSTSYPQIRVSTKKEKPHGPARSCSHLFFLPIIERSYYDRTTIFGI
jgi:hypothetical protein